MRTTGICHVRGIRHLAAADQQHAGISNSDDLTGNRKNAPSR